MNVKQTPKGWKEKTLGEVITFQRGHDLVLSKIKSGKYPVIKSNGIGGYHNEFKANGPGVTIGRSGKLGDPFYIESDYWPHNTTLYSKTFHNSNPKFVYYLLKTLSLVKFNVGSAVPTLNRNHIHPIPVMIPDNIHEQESIAKILSDIDSKIELKQNIIKTLNETGKELFKHWFINFEFFDESGKPYKSSGGKIVYNEEWGMKIPNGWKIRKLDEYVDGIKGCSYRSADLKESSTALVTLKSINRGGGFNQNGYKEFVGEYNDNQILKNGEIVIAQTDLTQKAEVIGRPAIVNSLGKYSTLIASLDLQIIRPKNDFSKNFVYYLMKTKKFHNHALSYTNGTTVLHLNKNAVPEFVFIVPPKEILDKFDNMVEPILSNIIISESEIQILSNIRDYILPKLMSGKIKIPMEIN